MSAFRGGGAAAAGHHFKGVGSGGTYCGGGPSATSTVIRRLKDGTPPKNNPATSSSGDGSSSSAEPPVIVNGYALPPGVPNMSKLTAAEKLEIIRNLRTNEYIPGAGMAQWMPREKPSNTKGPVVKNLREAFDSDASSGGFSVIKGPGGTDRFVETQVLEEGRDEDADDTCSTFTSKSEIGDDNKPEIVKMVEDFLTLHDHYKIYLERAIEAVVEKNFAEVFPEGRAQTLFRELDEFMASLEKFNNQNPSENMKLFFPSDSKPNKNTINCPVEQQEELLATVYKLSNIMAKLNVQMMGDGWKNMESNVQDKLDLFKKTVDKMERDLKDLDYRKKSIMEGYALLSTFANHNSSGSSGDMLNLEMLRID